MLIDNFLSPILLSVSKKALYYVGIHLTLHIAILVLTVGLQFFGATAFKSVIRKLLAAIMHPRTLVFSISTFLWGIFQGLKLEYQAVHHIPFNLLYVLIVTSFLVGIATIMLRNRLDSNIGPAVDDTANVALGSNYADQMNLLQLLFVQSWFMWIVIISIYIETATVLPAIICFQSVYALIVRGPTTTVAMVIFLMTWFQLIKVQPFISKRL